MAFSVNYGRPPRQASRAGEPVNAGRFLATVIVLFALFSVYDYSSYGDGYVAAALGAAQRWFQGVMAGFRVRV